jgi:hypothetical protein
MSTVSPLPAIKGSSANVRLTLYIGLVAYKIAQMSEDFFILSQPVPLPGTSGTVCIQIDEYEQRKVATWEASEAPRRMVTAVFSPLA